MRDHRDKCLDKQAMKERAKHLLTKEDAKPSMYINDLSRLFDINVSAGIDKFTTGRGVSKGSRHILFHLERSDGITQLQLSKLTHLTAPSISAAVVKMEQEGLVVRRNDSEDMRQVRVYLTDKGRQLNDLIKQKSRETEDMMLKGLSDDEQEYMCRLLKKMLTNMVENGV